MSPWESSNSEQTAGLSTAEDDCSSSTMRDVSKHSSSSIGLGFDGSSKHNHGAAAAAAISGSGDVGNSTSSYVPPLPSEVASPTSPKSRTRRFKRGSTRGSDQDTSVQGISLNESISNSAPTILIHTPSSTSSDDPSVRGLRQPLRSSMSARTLHESLHRGQTQVKGRPKMERSVSFAQVNIREYERVMGDNRKKSVFVW